jgi:hypothetical protein
MAIGEKNGNAELLIVEAPTVRRSLLVSSFVAFALALAFLYGVSVLIATPGVETGLVVLFLGVGVLIHTVWHEFGHVAAGLLVGFRINMIGILGVAYDFRQHRFTKPWVREAVGGFVHADPGPTPDVGTLRRRVRVFAAGGLIASTLFASGIVGYVYAHPSTPHGHATALMAFALLVGIGSWLPGTQNLPSDVSLLLAPRRRVLATWTMASLISGLAQGRPLHEQRTADQLEPLLPPTDSAPESLELLYVALRLEAGHVDKARVVLEHLQAKREQVAQFWRTDVDVARAGVALFHDADVNAARAIAESVRTQDSWYPDLLVACIAHVERNTGARDAALANFLVGIRGSQSPTMSLGGNLWLLQRLSREGVALATELLALNGTRP